MKGKRIKEGNLFLNERTTKKMSKNMNIGRRLKVNLLFMIERKEKKE